MCLCMCGRSLHLRPLLQRENSEWREGVFPRVAHGLIAVLLALKKKPFIRYVPLFALVRLI